jgi:hypothetical protein
MSFVYIYSLYGLKRELQSIEQEPAEEEKAEEATPAIEAESGSEEDGEEEPKPGANPWTRLKRACAATVMMSKARVLQYPLAVDPANVGVTKCRKRWHQQEACQ